MDEIEYHKAQEAHGLGAALVHAVATLYGCDENEASCERAVYKCYDCGPWLMFTEAGLRMGSIVEGSDAEFEVTPLLYHENVTDANVHEWLREAAAWLEGETSLAWEEAND